MPKFTNLVVKNKSHLLNEASIHGDVSMSKSLKVVGDTTLQSNVSVGDTLNVSSRLSLGGSAIIGGNVSVAGVGRFDGNMQVAGTLSIAGNSTLVGTLSTTNTTVNGTLSVTGAVSVSGATALSSTETITILGTGVTNGLVISRPEVPTGGNSLQINDTGATGVVASQITSSTVSGSVMTLTGNSITTGSALTVTANAITTGKLISATTSTNITGAGRYFTALETTNEVFGIGINGHIHTSSTNLPSIVTHTISGSDTAGLISFTIATANVISNGTVTFGKVYQSTPKAVLLQPANIVGATNIALIYISALSTTSFTISSSAVLVGADPSFYYLVIA
jgi:cytoskeletal protein CcmA (bactofilin family)